MHVNRSKKKWTNSAMKLVQSASFRSTLLYHHICNKGYSRHHQRQIRREFPEESASLRQILQKRRWRLMVSCTWLTPASRSKKSITLVFELNHCLCRQFPRPAPNKELVEPVELSLVNASGYTLRRLLKRTLLTITTLKFCVQIWHLQSWCWKNWELKISFISISWTHLPQKLSWEPSSCLTTSELWMMK